MDAEAVNLAGNNTGMERHGRRGAPAREWFERLLARADIRVNGDRPWDMQLIGPNVPERVLGQGTVGLGETYMDGHWTVERLDQFFHRIVRAQMALGEHGPASGTRPPVWHFIKARWLNRQTKRRAWEVAQRHYDLGNDFYEAMLEDGMSPTAALRESQRAMRENPARRQPYYWASFVIQGDWQ